MALAELFSTSSFPSSSHAHGYAVPEALLRELQLEEQEEEEGPEEAQTLLVEEVAEEEQALPVAGVAEECRTRDLAAEVEAGEGLPNPQKVAAEAAEQE